MDPLDDQKTNYEASHKKDQSHTTFKKTGLTFEHIAASSQLLNDEDIDLQKQLDEIEKSKRSKL